MNKPVSILYILKYYGYSESVYKTATQDFLNSLIRKYYAEHNSK